METTIPQTQQSVLLRVLAHFFSIVFHPLFIPAYTIAFLLSFHPTFFAGFSEYDKYKILLSTILNTVFFPAFAVLLMKGLRFISSIRLTNQQDRIGPYLAAMIFYFWAAWVFFKMEPVADKAIASFMAGVFLTSVAGLLANIYFKISMHAMGIGGLVGFFIIIMQTNTMLMTWPLSLALLIGGIVCTSRLLLNDHHPRDIYAGLFAGLLCQVIAAAFIL